MRRPPPLRPRARDRGARGRGAAARGGGGGGGTAARAALGGGGAFSSLCGWFSLLAHLLREPMEPWQPTGTTYCWEPYCRSSRLPLGRGRGGTASAGRLHRHDAEGAEPPAPYLPSAASTPTCEQLTATSSKLPLPPPATLGFITGCWLYMGNAVMGGAGAGGSLIRGGARASIYPKT